MLLSYNSFLDQRSVKCLQLNQDCANGVLDMIFIKNKI